MSNNIRRQSIISSVIIYTGFAIGLINIYFFTKQGIFTTEEYGLTSIFIAVASLITSFSSMAMPSYIYKFYPYYNAHLEPKKNDMLAWALLIGIAGFCLVTFLGIVLEDLVARKYSQNSKLFVHYYYWVYPMSLGFTVYSILEAYAWSLHKSILTTFIKEVEWRLLTTIIILLFVLGVIPDFDLFIKLYAFTYPAIAVTLLLYLIISGKAHFSFKISKVSRRFFSIMTRFCSFVYSAGVVFTLSQVFDQIVIASVLKNGLEKGAVFALAQLLTSIIQAPQRGIIAASIPHLSQSWKDKKLDAIKRIYQRSSINLLIFAVLIYILILLNYKQAIITLGLNPQYLLGFSAFVLLGFTRVVDLGTGVNREIIGTSNFWKFEFGSGIVLLLFMLPLNYVLTLRFDILGPAMANLVSITVYNAIRVWFLWYKFKLMPFTMKSLYTLLLGTGIFIATYFLFDGITGFTGLVTRSLFAMILFGTGVVLLKLTPDLRPVLLSLLNRYPFRKKNTENI